METCFERPEMILHGLKKQYLKKKTLIALDPPPFMANVMKIKPLPKFLPFTKFCIYVELEWNEFARIWIGDLHDFFAILHVLHFPNKVE